MNRALAGLQGLWADRHMRWFVIIVASLFLVCQIGEAWLPAYSAQFQKTDTILIRFALIWSLIVGAGPDSPEKPTLDDRTKPPAV